MGFIIVTHHVDYYKNKLKIIKSDGSGKIIKYRLHEGYRKKIDKLDVLDQLNSFPIEKFQHFDIETVSFSGKRDYYFPRIFGLEETYLQEYKKEIVKEINAIYDSLNKISQHYFEHKFKKFKSKMESLADDWLKKHHRKPLLDLFHENYPFFINWSDMENFVGYIDQDRVLAKVLAGGDIYRNFGLISSNGKVVDFDFNIFNDRFFSLWASWDEAFAGNEIKKDILEYLNNELANLDKEYVRFTREIIKEIEENEIEKSKEIIYTFEWSNLLVLYERLTIDEIKDVIDYLVEVLRIIVETDLFFEIAFVSFNYQDAEWEDICTKFKRKKS